MRISILFVLFFLSFVTSSNVRIPASSAAALPVITSLSVESGCLSSSGEVSLSTCYEGSVIRIHGLNLLVDNNVSATVQVVADSTRWVVLSGAAAGDGELRIFVPSSNSLGLNRPLGVIVSNSNGESDKFNSRFALTTHPIIYSVTGCSQQLGYCAPRDLITVTGDGFTGFIDARLRIHQSINDNVYYQCYAQSFTDTSLTCQIPRIENNFYVPIELDLIINTSYGNATLVNALKFASNEPSNNSSTTDNVNLPFWLLFGVFAIFLCLVCTCRQRMLQANRTFTSTAFRQFPQSPNPMHEALIAPSSYVSEQNVNNQGGAIGIPMPRTYYYPMYAQPQRYQEPQPRIVYAPSAPAQINPPHY